ncbi:hypothetical protein SCA6_015044 [Theobroma cacao]
MVKGMQDSEAREFKLRCIDNIAMVKNELLRITIFQSKKPDVRCAHVNRVSTLKLCPFLLLFLMEIIGYLVLHGIAMNSAVVSAATTAIMLIDPEMRLKRRD